MVQSRVGFEHQDPIFHPDKHLGEKIGLVPILLLSLLTLLTLAGCGMAGGTSSNSTPKQNTTASGNLAVVPSTVGFGKVGVGNTNSQTVTLTNTGGSSLTLSQAKISTSGFSMTGLSLPMTLSADQSAKFNLNFSPSAVGDVSASLVLMSDAVDSSLTVPVTGTGVESQLSVVPSTVAFGDVVVGNTNTQTITVTNSGNADFTLSQANVTGNGFSVTGLTLPATVAAGHNTSFNVAFKPASAGSFSGSLSLVSNAPDSPTVIPLGGTGVAATQDLSISPASLSFGNVKVGQTDTKSVTVSNSGNSSITISQVNVSGDGFSASGLTPPVTLDPGQNATISVVFAPTVTGDVTGSLSVVSDAANSPSTAALSGSGVTTTSHTVTLNWSASTSTVAGYNVYRSSQTGGPYTKLDSSLITGTSFTDSNVQAGQTYFYVTTAVDSNNVESAYSNEVSAAIPSP